MTHFYLFFSPVELFFFRKFCFFFGFLFLNRFCFVSVFCIKCFYLYINLDGLKLADCGLSANTFCGIRQRRDESDHAAFHTASR